jgi:hypothetical protein
MLSRNRCGWSLIRAAKRQGSGIAIVNDATGQVAWAAACVGTSTPETLCVQQIILLLIQAMGRQRRQMCLLDSYGFPARRGKE